MKTQKRGFCLLAAACFAAGLLLSAQAAESGYTPVNLVSDIAGVARYADPLLVNPWGLAVTPAGRIWVADNGTGFSTFYKPNGVPLSVTVAIPAAPGSTKGGRPTGLVMNPATNFVMSFNSISNSSLFLFCTEDGTISGWNPSVDPSNAIVMVDHSISGAAYTGIAMGIRDGSNFLYVANFSAGVVDMYDDHFVFVRSFGDPGLDVLVSGYSPYNVQNIEGRLFVAFARKYRGSNDSSAGSGHGYIDIFGTDGSFEKRLVSKGRLNSPWGMALAPDNFGKFSRALLVGNFGDGRINAYRPSTGLYLGQLTYHKGDPITIDGLRGLAFAPADAGDTNVPIRVSTKDPVLYFTAGIADEVNGLFGFIRPALATDFK
jgi:uncharacterized protein (TIGR03118 family)